MPTSSAVLYGVAAGWAMWLTSFPLDVLKSRAQTDGFRSQGDKRRYHGVADIARQIYRDQGVKGFFRGLAPTLIRSPFVNGATFGVYEAVRGALG
jgi:solute carrier family 25 carnitine/acylcarnitine transporter 20/29